MPAPTDHYRLSPSKSSIWMACPYSLRAPASEPSAAADAGTIAHGFGASVLTGECDLSAVPSQYAAGVAAYVQHVQANGVEPLVERKWESLEIDGYGGTIDCLLIQDVRAAVYDFKFGRWPVGATGNSQLLCYSSIVAEHFPVTEFYGVIVQPNAGHYDQAARKWVQGDKIKVAQYSLEQVNEHRERVKWAAANPDHKEAGEHCRWCELRKQKMCIEGVKEGWTRGWK